MGITGVVVAHRAHTFACKVPLTPNNNKELILEDYCQNSLCVWLKVGVDQPQG